MTGNQLAKQVKPAWRRAGEKVAPFGVFLRGAATNPRMVGAAFPSSRATIDKMLTKVDWASLDLVVEYGPGAGAFCRDILERLGPQGRLLSIDTNPAFVAYLSKEISDPRFQPVQGSAGDVEAIVRAAGYDHADCVISGLPFSTLPKGVGEEIAQATYRVLRPGGAFLTYQYSLVARGLTERLFDRVEKDMTLRNVPPNWLTWGWKEA